MAKRGSKISKDVRNLRQALERSRELKRRHYTVSELVEATGITLRQVRNWREEGLLLPCITNPKARGSQPAMFYSAKQVLRVLVILELRAKGLTLKQIKRVEGNLKKMYDKQLEEATRFLLTDGQTAFYAETKTRVVDILKHASQLTLVDVWEHMSNLKQKLRKVA